MSNLGGALPYYPKEGRGRASFVKPLGGVLIPYALDGDALVFHLEAKKGPSYSCISCAADLVFKRGEEKVPHFAHAVDPTAGGCSPETVLHRTAKRLLLDHVRAGGALKSRHRCFCGGQVSIPLTPPRGAWAEEEYRLPSGHRADVAVLFDGTPFSAIEVFVAHRVEQEKAASFRVPWVEVDALDIVVAKGRVENLVSVRRPDIRWPICDACAEAMEWTTAEYPYPVDFSLYRPKRHLCWECKRFTPVFLWEEKQLFDSRTPPEPTPPTLRRHRGKPTATSKAPSFPYWASHCMYCSTAQGDYYTFGMGNTREHLLASRGVDAWAL